MALAIVIMAAGKGTRMHSDLPKVLHKANGKPLLGHVLDKALQLKPEKTVLIVGHKAEMVREAMAGYRVEFALQEPQLGTGHAVMQAEKALEGFEGEVLILSGDAPLFTLKTLRDLIDHHRRERAAGTVLTADMEDPAGYGRIIRDKESGNVLRIVEQKDANEREKATREINSGVYLFDAQTLFMALQRIGTDNAQQEYYLTDVFAICLGEGHTVAAWKTGNPDEIHGINTPEQLQAAERLLALG